MLVELLDYDQAYAFVNNVGSCWQTKQAKDTPQGKKEKARKWLNQGQLGCSGLRLVMNLEVVVCEACHFEEWWNMQWILLEFEYAEGLVIRRADTNFSLRA